MNCLPFHKSSIGQAYAVLPKDVGDWQWNTDSLRHLVQPSVKFFKLLMKHERFLYLKRDHTLYIPSNHNKELEMHMKEHTEK